ncbi:MAG: hypothetical protein ACLFS6_06535 [Methanomassiliicoccales archaeon]
MAFIIRKWIHDCGPYYYLVESYRNQDGEPRLRNLKYLGKDIPQDCAGRYSHPSGAPISSSGDQEELEKAREEAREELKESDQETQEALSEVKADGEVCDSEPRASPEDRERVKSERTQKTAEELREELDEAQTTLDDYHKEELEVSKKSRRKWDPERKRRARQVADTADCSVIEADAMIQRANRAGYDHDEVNWDRVQGKDLEYSERVHLLDKELHVETKTKGETERSFKETEDLIAKWEEDPDAYQDELESAMRDMHYSMMAEVY